METIEQKIQKGAVWMVLFRVAAQGLGLINTVVLARLLLPADFGLVAMATVVIFFVELVSAFGFDTALIQNQSAERQHFDTAWTLNVLFGAVKAVILILLAIPVSHFYQEPRLVNILFVLALAPLIKGVENIGVVAFRKEMAFDQEFKFRFMQSLAGYVVIITIALLFRSYWALVIGSVISPTFGVALSYFVHPYRPKFCLTEMHELIGFSKWLLLNNFIAFFYQRSADLVLGKVVGVSGLGLYNIAFRISTLPTTELIAPINRVIFPGYAKMSVNKATLREGFLKVISVVALLAIPAAVGIAATAGFLVNVVLGEKWGDAVPLIQILAFYGAITALRTNTYYVHLALGNVRTYTALIGTSLIILIPLLITLAIRMGAVGATIAYLLVAICFFPFYYRAVMKKLDLALGQLIRYFWRPVMAAATMYVILQWAQNYVTVDKAFDDWVELCGLIILGGFTYCISVLGFWHLAGRPGGPERFVLDKLALAIRKRFPQAKTQQYPGAMDKHCMAPAKQKPSH